MEEVIYFDNNATTQIDERVLERMLPFFGLAYGNPASQHFFGALSRNAVEEAREAVLKLINGRSGDLIFTSGATEGLNIALKGVAFAAGDKNKIITVQTEHQAVLDTCKYLEQVGFEVVYLPVDQHGRVSVEQLRDAVDEATIAVCVMLVNNETGVIQPIRGIAEFCASADILLICDGTQALGKIHVDVLELGVDIFVFSAHKFHGPKGVGAVYFRRGLVLSATIHGGGHERGLRSGSLNVPGIIGMAEACRIAIEEIEENRVKVRALRDKLEDNLLALPGARLNGHPLLRAPNMTNISFDGIDAGTLIAELKELAVSNGSACTSAVFEPSHVLKAMGLDDASAFEAIRFSLSKFNSDEEVTRVTTLIRSYLQLRALP